LPFKKQNQFAKLPTFREWEGKGKKNKNKKRDNESDLLLLPPLSISWFLSVLPPL
jgi:hypothetical protein